MAEVTTSELKALLESQAARDERRREADVERFARFEGIVQTLTNEVAHVRKRQDLFDEWRERADRELAMATGRAKDAQDATASLEGRLVGAVNGFADRVNSRLVSQDSEIAHIKKATDAQTPMLTQLMVYMNGAQANAALLKWLVPLTGSAIVVLVPLLWYIFGIVSHH